MEHAETRTDTNCNNCFKLVILEETGHFPHNSIHCLLLQLCFLHDFSMLFRLCYYAPVLSEARVARVPRNWLKYTVYVAQASWSRQNFKPIKVVITLVAICIERVRKFAAMRGLTNRQKISGLGGDGWNLIYIMSFFVMLFGVIFRFIVSKLFLLISF